MAGKGVYLCFTYAYLLDRHKTSLGERRDIKTKSRRDFNSDGQHGRHGTNSAAQFFVTDWSVVFGGHAFLTILCMHCDCDCIIFAVLLHLCADKDYRADHVLQVKWEPKSATAIPTTCVVDIDIGVDPRNLPESFVRA